MTAKHMNYLRRKTADEAELWAANRIEQLESERDELRADAMRYRWLRDNPWDDELTAVITYHRNALFDSTIDAAIAKGEKHAKA